MDIKSLFKSLIPRNLWRYIRLQRILAAHRRVAEYWEPLIAKYERGEIAYPAPVAKKDLSGKRIIWQYWGQGVDAPDMPEIVRICFASVDKYKGDYEVIRLSDDTIAEYVDLPPFVWEKLRHNPSFTRTFFSDLLRVALLRTYGGVWLDATILMTGQFPQSYEQEDHFLFRRDETEKDKKYWESAYAFYYGWHLNFKVRMLSSIFFAQKGSKTINALYELMLYLWEHAERNPDYFSFQILYEVLKEKGFIVAPIVSDCVPHLLQTKINGTFDAVSFEEVFALTPLHKMAYLNDEALARLKEVLGNHERSEN